jgi:hypothetical protein
MTDAHTPAVLRDEDQGSSAARIPTEPLDDPWAELERLAKAATPGEWGVEDPMDHCLTIVSNPAAPVYDWKWIATCNWPDEDDHLVTSAEVKANAAFIAATNPATILKLIEAARQGPTGYGAKRSAPKPSEPTPVRGLEPVAWRHRRRDHTPTGWVYNECAGGAGPGSHYEVQPLYSASDVSALQGEVERLRKVLTKIATQKGISAVGIARQALGEQQ